MPAKAGISCGKRYLSAWQADGYIMASKLRGMLYVGVPAYVAERVDQHRRDKSSAYCR